MAECPLHVVFGAGNVGRTLATHLSERGLAVRVVSRSQPSELPGAVEWRGADASNTEAATEAATDAAVVYQCLNAPYPKWWRTSTVTARPAVHP
jgi:predicted dinucleotide-binding enzyme